MDLTIDSSAAEHVIGPKTLSHVLVRTSESSKMGVLYVAANVSKTVNQGEQVVSATTGSGQRCRFKLQSATPVSPSHELFASEDDEDQEDSERDVGFVQEKAEDEAQKAVGF